MKPRIPLYTVGSLFSGIGGIDLAFVRAGFAITFQVEIDDYCNRVLKRHFPNVPRFRDVRTVGAANLPACDVLVGGFPCQDISNAGKGAGIKEGTRSGLWIEFARIIGELRPRFVLLENVAAITSRDGTRVIADLATLGYDAEWGVIPASAVGAPHRRCRWWCVAYTGSVGRQESRSEQDAPPDPQWNLSPSECAGCHRDGTWQLQQNGSLGNFEGRSEYRSEELALSNGSGWQQEQPRNQDGTTSGGVGQADTEGQRLEEFIGESAFAGSADTGAMGHTASQGLQGAIQPNAYDPLTTEDKPHAQSILGRAVDGLSQQLDGSRWPTRHGEAQYHWEAPRTSAGVRNRTARLKALGNAVVPQVVQPLAEAIREALAHEDSTAR